MEHDGLLLDHINTGLRVVGVAIGAQVWRGCRDMVHSSEGDAEMGVRIHRYPQSKRFAYLAKMGRVSQTAP